MKEDAALLDAVAGQESRPERTDFLFYTVVYAFNDSKERGLAIMKVPKTKQGSRCLLAELETLLMVAACEGVVRVIDHCFEVSACRNGFVHSSAHAQSRKIEGEVLNVPVVLTKLGVCDLVSAPFERSNTTSTTSTTCYTGHSRNTTCFTTNTNNRRQICLCCVGNIVTHLVLFLGRSGLGETAHG